MLPSAPTILVFLVIEKPPALNETRSKHEQKSVLSDYSFKGYCESLYLNPEDLNGKTILDLGSGEHENFSREAIKVGATVVSLNPQLLRENIREKVVNFPDWEKKSVAGRAQQLPFKDGSFDLIVSYFAIPTWVPRESHEMFEKEMLQILTESLRVLEPGGRVILSPIVWCGQDGKDQMIVDNLGSLGSKFLREQGCKVDFRGNKWENGAVVVEKPVEKQPSTE